MRKEVKTKLTFKQDTDYEARLAAAYSELFEQIQPSGQLLSATRRLYQQTPRRQTIGRRFIPITATLCAACLLLAIGLQFWPQPDNFAPDNSMQMRMASQLDETSSITEQMPTGRMAEPSAQTEPNDGIALLNDGAPIYESSSELASTPKLCGLPLENQDCAKHIFVTEPPTTELSQNIVKFMFVMIRWLGVW